MPPSASPNQPLLDQVNGACAWVPVRKTRPVWAKRLEADAAVTTREGTAQARAGDFICRGEVGEQWPQTEANLLKRYTATEETDAEGWRKYVPRPDAEGALAARMAEPFTVRAPWGELSGKAGDYLLKHAADRDVAYPEDVWIVDAAIFEATYADAAQQTLC